MACENKKRKHTLFSLTEIEAARLLIQLGNSIADCSTSTACDHHSVDGYSVQSKPQDTAVEDVLAEIEEDERLRRRNNRYRYVRDLYKATHSLLSKTQGNNFMERH
ncbi:hypothetical protein Fmac_010096 [Flemingia macrophylla]|uniref:Uncharacterized protein n=1 Tax=Flemingia macrophylla TaxID=520843 RepID=A0ABD1N235_9FABA